MFDLIFLLNSNLPFENNEITKEKVIAGVLIVFIYLIPSFIARDKIQFKYIVLFNVLFGFTGIGWLISLVWSINAKSKTIDFLRNDNDLDE